MMFSINVFQVYLPMLMMHQMKVTGAGYQSQAASPQQNSVEGADKSPVKSTIRIPIRDELLNRTHKYLGLINTSLQHLQIQGLVLYPRVILL